MTAKKSAPAAKPAVLPEGHARLSLSDIVWLLLNRERASMSSVKLTRNAKGDTQIEVNVYLHDLEEGSSVFDAERVANEMYERECTKWPTAEGTVRRVA